MRVCSIVHLSIHLLFFPYSLLLFLLLLLLRLSLSLFLSPPTPLDALSLKALLFSSLRIDPFRGSAAAVAKQRRQQ
jgi:hypothetical protein